MSKSHQSDDSIDWSYTITTEHARRRLTNILYMSLSEAENSLIDAPTSLGKTHTVASTRWTDYPHITGGEPVIHFHATAKTREDAAEMSKQASIKQKEVKSGLEVCPVALGDFDAELPSVGGKSASTWLETAVNHGGYEFHNAHRMLGTRIGYLPCETDDGCPSQSRWKALLRDDDGRPIHDIIHATYEFAYVEPLITNTNVIFDEQPAFNEEVRYSPQATSLQDSVNVLLGEYGDEMSWVNLVQAILDQNPARLSEYREALADGHVGPMYSSSGYSHRATNAVVEAFVEAKRTLLGRRYVGQARDTQVVLDEQGTLRQIHRPPDLSEARCVIGLDAYPSTRLWRLNTIENLQPRSVLSSHGQTRWRTERRGLNIVQVGQHTRSYTLGWRGKGREKAEAIISELRRQYGSAFRTSISSMAIEDDVRGMLADTGVENPETMHFGDLKSRNDFNEESIGLVVGCIDPGDDRILDLLALSGLNAVPKLDEGGGRKYGREFIGPDADAAAEFLASVRENNLAQAVGRYARNPEKRGSEATVYVWSDALSDSLTDDVVPGVISQATDLKDEIAQYLRREKAVTKKQVAEEVNISPTYAYEVLQKMADQGVVTISKGTGYYGADEYTYVAGTVQRSVDLGF